MNGFEKKVAEHLAKQGYEVLRNGWPDFLCIKRGPFKVSAFCVEVKTQKDKLSEAQVKIHKILKAMGVPVYVMRERDLVESKKKGKALFCESDLTRINHQLAQLAHEVSRLHDAEKQINELRELIAEVPILFEADGAPEVQVDISNPTVKLDSPSGFWKHFPQTQAETLEADRVQANEKTHPADPPSEAREAAADC